MTGDVVLMSSARYQRRVSLPLREVEWHPDTSARAATVITMPGFRKGQKPPNAGRKFPADPPTPDECVRLLDACRHAFTAGIAAKMAPCVDANPYRGKNDSGGSSPRPTLTSAGSGRATATGRDTADSTAAASTGRSSRRTAPATRSTTDRSLMACTSAIAATTRRASTRTTCSSGPCATTPATWQPKDARQPSAATTTGAPSSPMRRSSNCGNSPRRASRTPSWGSGSGSRLRVRRKSGSATVVARLAVRFSRSARSLTAGTFADAGGAA